MTDPIALLALGFAGTVALGVTAVATLRAWHEWLELRRDQLARNGGRATRGRTELSELRERVKRLEVIANG